MTPSSCASLMAAEAAEAAAAVRRQTAASADLFAALGRRLRASPPPFVVTCARGSSDHACSYGKYLIETVAGRVVASVGPSVASVYQRRLAMRGALFIAVSQSGRSPDLLRLTEAARAEGALVVGFVNDPEAPLAALCEMVIPLAAGPERSVAATKSCLASMAAFLHLVAGWSEQPGVLAQLHALPAALEAACGLDWFPALRPLVGAGGLYVVGRGPALGVAAEMALKCKETCRLHAEAFSAAELIHGPLELVRDGFPVLALAQPDAAAAQTRQVLERLVALGGQVFTTAPDMAGTVALPVVDGMAAEVMPLLALQSFYLAASRLARARGLDPDAPSSLQKVTRTV
ncbi:SIS domain-containing protein [Rhodovastum atsumiense]|uniref:SIS domain-containing protein n=1 Tax=Rhodovastum atsumiense TaxID=504468 RepID=A0A5M6J0I9_9PROT|nr:SIS domain-containing protein [Rhodovastum atsumiense]KAA5614104.1 SIS domain-containing protein [Rhodovastum atsumiense]